MDAASEPAQSDVDAVRASSGVSAPIDGTGPDDTHILAGLVGYVRAFDYWYIRVMREAVPKYRNILIARANPFIRRMQLEGRPIVRVAEELVRDYDARNFVTAGGWALEELAVATGPNVQKSASSGIDLQRHEAASNSYHLYVFKSGLVTRNSDIVAALKRNTRAAEKLLRQGRSTVSVHANYAIAAGRTRSTFEDGVYRPSSAKLWAELLELNEDSAVNLVKAMALQAGRYVTRDAAELTTALRTLVGEYLREAEGDRADWDFLARRTLTERTNWAAEDKERHDRAVTALDAAGLGRLMPRRERKAQTADVDATDAEVEDIDVPEGP